MESSQTLLRLGHIRASRSDRSISRRLSVLLCDPTGTSSRHVLPVLLLPLPTVLHLRNLRLLLALPNFLCYLRLDTVVVVHIDVLQLEKRGNISEIVLQEARGIWMTNQDCLRDIDDEGLTVPDDNVVGAKVSVYQMSPGDKLLQCR